MVRARTIPLPVGTAATAADVLSYRSGPVRRVLAVLLFVSMAMPLALPVAADDTLVGADTFTRSVSGGWGTADAGGAWSAVGGASALSVKGDWGIVRVPSGGAMRGALQRSLDVLGLDLQVRMKLEKLPTGGNAHVYLVGRRSGDNEYRLKIRITNSGAVWLQGTRVIGGTETSLDTEVRASGVALTAGSVLQVHGRIAGTSPTSHSA